VTFMFVEFGAKRLELLRQMLPNATKIAMLMNPNFPLPSAEEHDVNAAARYLGSDCRVGPGNFTPSLSQIRT
jgi:hypothetical protein